MVSKVEFGSLCGSFSDLGLGLEKPDRHRGLHSQGASILLFEKSAFGVKFNLILSMLGICSHNARARRSYGRVQPRLCEI